MLNDYMGILYLNEKEDKIKRLTRNRTLAAVPIGGRYRIIDFVLSNMVNGGIKNIGVFTQSKSRALLDHLEGGKPWDLNRKRDGIFVFNYGSNLGIIEDIEMFKENLDYINFSRQKNVILSPSYMICNIDYVKAVKFHEERKSDITVIYKKVNNGKESFLGCDILNIDEKGKVVTVGTNIGVENQSNISLEMFIMKKSILIELVYKSVISGFARTIKDAIYKSVDNLKINGYEYKGYLECINSTMAYYKANMDMLDLEIVRELFYNNGLIYTKVKDEPPTKYIEGSKVSNSLIANGGIIEGKVENSIIFRRVTIGKGAEIKNSIILQNCTIGEGVKLDHVIVDKNNYIGNGRELKGDREVPIVIEKQRII